VSVFFHEPDARQDVGFYRFLIDALRRCAGARPVGGPRPLPRMEHPRQHESLWIDWNGVPVVVDMSDHIFLFDLPALERCGVYFKANLNPALAKKVLERSGAAAHAAKIRPFVFLPATLAGCARLASATAWARKSAWRPFDFFHVVGVYENPFLHGVPPEADMDIPAGLKTNHFWTRYQVQRALRETGMRGFCRLTNRSNSALLDAGGVVRANLDPRVFLLGMLASRMTVLNTLPHAVFPWKALESVALGIPFVVERRPLIAMPPPFDLVPGKHYLELLPELPGFDETAEPDDVRAYRLFPEIRLQRLRERAQWLKDEIRNPDRMAAMRAEVDAYRRRVLNPSFIVQFLAETVEQAAAERGESSCGS